MKDLIAVGLLVICVVFVGAVAYLAIAAPMQPCDFGPCVVKAQ